MFTFSLNIGKYCTFLPKLKVLYFHLSHSSYLLDSELLYTVSSHPPFVENTSFKPDSWSCCMWAITHPLYSNTALFHLIIIILPWHIHRAPLSSPYFQAWLIESVWVCASSWRGSWVHDIYHSFPGQASLSSSVGPAMQDYRYIICKFVIQIKQ